jgi:hypothetical protein
MLAGTLYLDKIKLASTLYPAHNDEARKIEMLNVVKTTEPDKLSGLKVRMGLGAPKHDPWRVRKEYKR